MPLLGRISRTRRAKSAGARSAKSASRDKRKLFACSESSSSDTVINVNVQKENDDSNLEYADERIKKIRESLKNGNSEFNAESLRPYNIDVALVCDET